ncbi:hypothetical protein CRG98_037799 [Punica granatum]|uniref:Uncharacterized protein n=1 Tax=Punica granatum TaxID=22663 RepID=A0A2I0ICU3_PUNGR|nr:hypothetical protein CRG98_037799 [Punica granatum]
MEELSEEERKALRGSKFAPLPSLPPPSQPSPDPLLLSESVNRLAHPGGAIKTNKAAALAKFLERKLQDPQGLASINPELVELAVRKAKDSVASGCASSSGTVRHVDFFDDPEDSFNDEADEDAKLKTHKNKKKKKDKDEKKKKKGKKKKKKSKKRKVADDLDKTAVSKKPKKKLKL